MTDHVESNIFMTEASRAVEWETGTGVLMTSDDAAKKATRFAAGSGNVFADVGIADPEGALAKARLAEAIDDTIERRGLTQLDAAAIIGVDQPAVSKIVNGRLDGFSQERLLRYLTALGNDVEIVVHRPESYEAEGHVSVSFE
ncbi:MAG: helix-turn-helix transcriptional regulator [Pirellulaceae bacterium]